MTPLSSLQNPLVKKVIKLKESKKFREEQGLTIVEGKNLLRDLQTHFPAPVLFVTEEHLDEAGPHETLVLVTPEVMRKMTGVDTPEGMLALYPIRSGTKEIASPLLILDGLQDPGNVGTLLRTASAFGIRHCVAIEPSVDLWHPKVLRSAKGAHYFFSSLFTTSWEELLPILNKNTIQLLVASLGYSAIDSIQMPPRWALVIGSESKGPSLPRSSPASFFTIPIHPHIESLNAAQAGAIALYYCTRECKAALPSRCLNVE